MVFFEYLYDKSMDVLIKLKWILLSMNGKTILITGVTGFIGNHLAHFIQRHYPTSEIIGVARSIPKFKYDYQFYQIDLACLDDVMMLVDRVKPDYIFHAAGLVFSFDWTALYYGNILPTINILSALRKTQANVNLVITGSSAEYGVIPTNNLPVTETYETKPQTPYGMIKLWQTLLVSQVESTNIKVTIGRIFNVIGAGASKNLSTGDLFSQMLRIFKREQEAQIWVGNTALKRDFLDIEDICSGLISIAKMGNAGEIYNICSGQSISLHSLLNMGLLFMKMDVKIVVDINKLQNTYIEDIYGCNVKIRKDTLWAPTIKIEESVRKALNLD